MLRDKSLIPLSRQHQHALALCVRIDRAEKAGELHAESWHAEIADIFEGEIRHHFDAEEKDVFPACAKFPELRGLVQELLVEHGELRSYFEQAKQGAMNRESLVAFGEKLSGHIRKEERRLFERLQQLAGAEELAAMGECVADHLREVADSCIVPDTATRLRSKEEIEKGPG